MNSHPIFTPEILSEHMPRGEITDLGKRQIKGIMNDLGHEHFQIFAHKLATFVNSSTSDQVKAIITSTDAEHSVSVYFGTNAGEYLFHVALIWHGSPEHGYRHGGAMQIEPSYGWQFHS